MLDDISAGDVITMGPNAGTVYDGKFGTVTQGALLGLQGLSDSPGILDSNPSSHYRMSAGAERGLSRGFSLFSLVLFLAAVIFIGMVARHMWLAWKAKDDNK